ncbi:uncharacterized protein LOC116197135 isoform X2 [Punica granatum]|uniref:Uncharacterized protein n=2 Tax=Punica granatum TaxID=22663 RepID=A0A218WP51_PUNGR|nr:uncharacterized protein LOC116197135 isoform X2 [Punica granatum]OWM74393.1 hypothetical protein CDL15_Pgr013297 [Punica granatum]PKI46257.1 hypothetical protein CRG98_033349 [Punica granatum]
MQIPGSDIRPNPTEPTPVVEVETVKCTPCGFTEECTPAYIQKVRERYQGKWLCGLCIEAVKDEALRSEELITVKEALDRHIAFCQRFRKFIPDEDSKCPMPITGSLPCWSLDSPPTLLSNSVTSLHRTQGLPARPVPASPLARSDSCFSFISS